MNFVSNYEGCGCKKNGCYDCHCPCFMRNVRCTSKCKCPAAVCVNLIGGTGDESNAEPGGQRGTSGTPDKAELEPESQIVQPRDTLPSAAKMDSVNYYMACWCKTDGCNDWRCPCFVSNVACSSKCLCPAPVCVNPIGVRGDEYTTFSAVSGWSDVYKAVESNAEPGGQQGTGGTSDIPDQAEPEPEPEPKRQAVQPRCCCVSTKCLDGYCDCFNGNWLCSEDCVCKGCRNIESNEKEVLMLYKEFVKRKSGIYYKFPLEPIPKRKLGAGALANDNLCRCTVYGCLTCSCVTRKTGCTLNCKCQDCRNPFGTREEDGVSNAGPGQTTSSTETKPRQCHCKVNGCKKRSCYCVKHKVGCTSYCKCQGCDNPKGAKGVSESNTGSGGADGVGNIPDEAVQTTTPSITEPGQVDTSSSSSIMAAWLENPDDWCSDPSEWPSFE